MKGYFITATDTDAGKTFVTAGLLQSLANAGYKTLGFKPVASGCCPTEQGLRNDDALALMQASSVKLDYAQINPYAFEPAIAPHLAAQQLGVTIELENIVQTITKHQHKADYVLVEGVGGWLVPLNERHSIADLAAQLNFPVIVVVRMRLGCINQALLTIQAIEQCGLMIAGWIANIGNSEEQAAPMRFLEENIQSLQQRIASPLLGVVPDLSQNDAQPGGNFSDFVQLD